MRRKLEGRTNLKKILSNTGWLFFDRIIRMGVGLVVGVWVTRYLGPEQFGLWNYTTAFTSLFGALATLGLDSIVIRELVRCPDRQNELLGTAFWLKLFGGLFTLCVTVLAISFVRKGETLALWLVALSAGSFIFQSFGVIDFYFQSQTKSRYTVYSANGSFIILAVIKVILLFSAAPLIAFAWAGLAEAALTTLFLTVAFFVNQQSIRDWRFNRKVAGELLRDSWPLILSTIAIMIYMRIDQIMIGQILGDKDVGIFSAAVRISEVWYFVPMAIASSVFPAIMESKKQGENIYYARLQLLFTLLAWLGILFAVIMTFASGAIVHLLFGDRFAAAAPILAIHSWSGIFVALGVASSNWYVIENLQVFTFYRTLQAAIVKISLNFFLIPRYGIYGAALATVLTYVIALFFDLFNKQTRIIFTMKLQTLFLKGIPSVT
ncbi:MAG: flippase [Candidatus Ozemobacteraceae bacterium]